MNKNGYYSYYENEINRCLEFILKNEKKQVIDSINSISIHADRGFGKTTLLELIKDKLDEESDVIVSDIIDPINLFKSQNNSVDNAYMLLEMALYTYYKNQKNNKNNDSKSELKKISLLIEKKNNISKNFTTVNQSGVSLLEKLESNFGVKEELNKLFRNKKIVIIIDDLDMLEVEMIAKITNELHDFIGVRNLYFITAYKQTQLIESLLANEYKDNKVLLDIKQVSSVEIQNRVTNKVMKIFPYEFTIAIPSLNSFYNSEYENNVSKKEYLFEKIEKRIGCTIKPFSPEENVNFLLPQSPRGYNQFLSILDEMCPLEDEKISITERMSSIHIFQEYIYTYLYESNMPIEYKNIIEKFRIVQHNEKNWTIVNGVRKVAQASNKSQSIANNTCSIIQERDAINTSLADVISSLNELKKISPLPLTVEFVYYIKLLLSLEFELLIEQFREDLARNEDYKSSHFAKTYENYTALINGNILPFDYNVFGLQDVYPRIRKKHLDQLENYNKAELSVALYTLVSFHSAGTYFVANSGIAKFLNDRRDDKLFKDETTSTRSLSTVHLYYKPASYDNMSYSEIFDHEHPQRIVNDIKVGLNIPLGIKKLEYVYDPMVFFSKKEFIADVFQSNIKSQIIVGNIFDLEAVCDHGLYRTGEKYPVTRVLKRYLSYYKLYTKSDDREKGIPLINKVLDYEFTIKPNSLKFVKDTPLYTSAKEKEEFQKEVTELLNNNEVKLLIEYLGKQPSRLLTQKNIGDSNFDTIKRIYKKEVTTNMKRHYLTSMVRDLCIRYNVSFEEE